MGVSTLTTDLLHASEIFAGFYSTAVQVLYLYGIARPSPECPHNQAYDSANSAGL
jgi:hypothetical protein